MRLPFRWVLPVFFSSLSVHNQRACALCDTGLPVWPYQAPSLFLRAINAPAFLVATPFFLLPHLQTNNARYPMLLAMIVLWWWWLGTRTDFGLLARRHYRSPKLQAVVVASIAVALLYVGARIVDDEIHRYLAYGPVHLLLLAA